MAPVHGTVTYRGKPLAEALVNFIPDTENVLPASGLTDAEGRYELMTRAIGDGCAVGKHRVTIIARAKPKTTIIGGPEGELLIPRKYTMADTSKLTAEVVSGQNVKDFDLGP
jgi:hypothetical protein